MSRPRAVGEHPSPVADQVARGLGLIRGGLAGFWKKIGGVTPYHGLRRFLEETYRALEEEREPPVGHADMERASALVTALLEGRSEA